MLTNKEKVEALKTAALDWCKIPAAECERRFNNGQELVIDNIYQNEYNAFLKIFRKFPEDTWKNTMLLTPDLSEAKDLRDVIKPLTKAIRLLKMVSKPRGPRQPKIEATA